MTGLALRSLRHRAPAQVATFTAVLLGTVLMGSFATLTETSLGTGVSDVDGETLLIMGSVVGGWGSAIVLFAIVSTLSTTVRQRTAEIGLLRTIGATPRQVGRLLRLETVAVAVVAAALGAGIALLTGRALLAMLRGHLVADSVTFSGTPASTGTAGAVVVLAAGLAAVISGHRATRAAPTLVLRTADLDSGRLHRWRVVVAVVLALLGLAGAVVTVTIAADAADPYLPMMTSGYSSILVGLAMALVAPALLRTCAPALRPLLGRGAAAHLAHQHTSRRAHLLAGVLAPIVVLTATAVGVVMLVGVDSRTIRADVEGTDIVNLLNYVVVGMLVVFASIMVVNALVAMLAHRRSELHQLGMIGATPEQITRTVVGEAVVVGFLGILLGTVAGAFTVVPSAIARDEGVVPDGQLWVPLVVAAGVLAMTLAAARTAVSRVQATAR